MIATLFTFIPLILYDDQKFQTYFFLSMPYHFTSAIFFNNSAKIWYRVTESSIQKLRPQASYHFIPFIYSIPFFLYFLYLSSAILTGFEILISLLLVLASPIHAHLGIMMVSMYNYSKKIPITFLLGQTLILIALVLLYVSSAGPILFVVSGIIYSILCVYFVRQLMKSDEALSIGTSSKINYVDMVRPDNTFHYLLVPMLGYFDPLVLKSLKSATSFAKIAFFCWPKHVDNELYNLTINRFVQVLTFCFCFSLVGILLLSELTNIFIIIPLSIIVSLFIILNRYVDISPNTNRRLVIGLNSLYISASVFFYIATEVLV